MRLALFAAAVAAPWILGSVSARAQSDAEDRATARALAQQGSDALDAKEYARAEDAFRRADALFHAPTLLLGLARAQAGEGKFVEAWESYNRIVLENVTTTPVFAKALEDAKKEIGRVGGRRSRVTMTVTGSSSPRVTLDGTPLKNEALGVPLFVDPGTHSVQVAADGFEPEARTLTVAEGARQNVALALEPAAPVAPIPVARMAPATEPPAADGPRVRPASRAPAIALFAAGGAGLVVGVATGALAIHDRDDLRPQCPGGTCPSSLRSEVDAYQAVARTATAAFVVAGLGAAAGTTLWILESKSRRSPASAWISPYVGVGGVGAAGGF